MKKFVCFLVLLPIFILAQDKIDLNPKLYGFVRAWYQIDSSFKQGSFAMKEARMGVRGNVNEFVTYRVFADFAKIGGTTTTTKKITYKDGTGTNQTETIVTAAAGGLTDVLLDAEATFTPDKSISFTLGQFVVPFGYENQKGNADIDFTNRGLLYGNITPDLRDLGFMASYNLPVEIPVNVKAGLFNGPGANRTETDRTANYSFLASAKPIKELGLSASYYGGRLSTDKVNIFSVSGDFKIKDLSVVGEFAQRKNDNGVTTITKSSYYAYAFYDFSFSNSMLTHVLPEFRYESLEPNADASNDKTSRISIGASLQFAKMNYGRIRVNYEIYDYENPAKDSKNKLMIEFLVRY